MPYFAKLIVPLCALMATVLAIPDVTAVPLTNGCADYPGYDPSTGLTAGFLLTTNSCENPDIEGFGDTCQVIRRQGDTGIVMGRISIADDNQLAKTVHRCNTQTGPGALEALTPTGVSGAAWNQVNMSYYANDMELGWGFGQYSFPVEAYSHFDEAGTQIEGVFLGSAGYTTWGVKWYQVGAGTLDGLPFWGLRLLVEGSNVPGTDEPLLPDEYRTFLKVRA